MRLVTKIAKMKMLSQNLRSAGKTIGFVPTMGYLHEGHLSLIRKARKDTDTVIVSIYVNPTQFAPKEDFKRYPRDLDRDRKLAENAGADILFVPSDSEMYPEPYNTYVTVKGLSDVMCGAFRTGHFRGVATIVAKLFNIIKPDVAYFGQKDAQQVAIIKKMVKDLNVDVDVRGMPIVRESDGLAMSSRNVYLNPQERREATVLSQSLQKAHDMIKSGIIKSSTVRAHIRRIISGAKSARIDYIATVDPETLAEMKTIKGKCLVAVAAWIGKTRLIDNIIVNA
jgi:pantoate--beta-alanine ligase